MHVKTFNLITAIDQLSQLAETLPLWASPSNATTHMLYLQHIPAWSQYVRSCAALAFYGLLAVASSWPPLKDAAGLPQP
jgi:hypothetical protein